MNSMEARRGQQLGRSLEQKNRCLDAPIASLDSLQWDRHAVFPEPPVWPGPGWLGASL